MKRLGCLMALLLLVLQAWCQSKEMKTLPEGVMAQAELEKVLPATAYFSGQVATVQTRNSGGVRSADGKLTMFVMVDSGGYSSSVRERYQFYVLTDTEVEFGGKRLPAGAYGAGFLEERGLVVMDLGGKEILQSPSRKASAMKRPRPLQVIADSSGEYRLYAGRAFVVFHQVR